MTVTSNAKAEILLPGNDFVVHTWKVKSGASVRKGETVAIARSNVGESSSTATVSTSSSIKQQQPPKQHKRPNRRRKLTPAAKSSDSSMANNTSVPSNPTTQPYQSAVAEATLQQRLARKLGEQKMQSAPSVDDKPPVKSDATSTSKPFNASISAGKTIETIPLLATADGILCISEAASQEESLIVAYIDECSHPGFLDGLCVVCGASQLELANDDSDNFSSSSPATSSPYLGNVPTSPEDKKSSPAHSQVTVSGGVTITVSEQEGRQMAIQDSTRLLTQKKLSLVLDLDHTLVHATRDPRAQQFRAKADDVRSLRLPCMEGERQHPNMTYMQHFAKLRPKIKEFFEIVQPMFELTVYTAGTRHYAEEITIVLCRHLVGSKRDIDDLDRLRYELDMAEMEYKKHSSLGSAVIENCEATAGGAENTIKKRKAEDGEENNHGDNANGSSEPPLKKKKVSFGAPKDPEVMDDSSPTPNNSRTNIDTQNKDKNLRSDHMTLSKVKKLRDEWKEAEELEGKARELRQKIFGSRVVSRTDVGDLGPDVKSLKRIFPCGGTMAAVLDDREDVWANATDNSDDTVKGEPPNNLLLVRPYHWQPFVGFADVNNAAGEDLSGTGNNDGSNGDNNGSDPPAETDVQLIWTSRILRGLHRRFYSQPKLENSSSDSQIKTVPEILYDMRKEVLKGSTLVLSGLVPLHKKTTSTNSARPPIVRYAQWLGAKTWDNVVPGVTHVVAAKDGTDKAVAARKIPGCVLVKPSWLVECYWSMTRRDFKPHLMGKGPDLPSQPSSSHAAGASAQQHHQLDESDSDSDDDELLAELEDEMM